MSRGRAGMFTTIRTEGGLLTGELLSRVAAGDATLRGLRAEDYHLARGERVGGDGDPLVEPADRSVEGVC